jgi:hypothetical protein
MDEREPRSLGFAAYEFRLPLDRGTLFLCSPLLRQVFVVVVFLLSRRRAGRDEPNIINLAPKKEQD